MGLNSVAIKCHHLESMVAFYTVAFGGAFKKVKVGGMRCQFGEIDGITFKLVSGREAVDFEGYPEHQLGFEVPDVNVVIAAAVEYGGAEEGPNCVRDPDGNTIELI